jgi:putative salt-induced outer membrane protein YdiY
MKSKKMAMVFAMIASACGIVHAHADEVVLANGDRISGKVLRKENGTLTMKTPYAGELNIKWADVRRIFTDTPIFLYLADQTKVGGTLRSEEDGSVIVTPAGAAPGAPIPLAQVGVINPSAEISGEAAKITGHVNAGLSSTSGNTQTRRIYFDAEDVIRTRDDRLTLGARGANTEDHHQNTESNWFGFLKYDHFFTRRWYGYANSDFENDRFKDIRLRTTSGLGSGYQFLETPATNLSVEGGLTYVHTDFIVAPNDSYPAGRWAVKFDHLLFDTRYQFFHMHEAVVSLQDTSNVFVRSQTGLRVPLMERLNATAQYNVDWENEPTNGRVRTDKALLLTLGYTW